MLVSSISFWEAALLNKKGKIEIKDVESWRNELLANTSLVLIVQANNNKAALVTKNPNIKKYPCIELKIALRYDPVKRRG